MGRLHVKAEQTARTKPDEVWALVCDATRYPEWGPWSDSGYQRPGDDSPRGPGAVYWLRSARRAYLRHATMVEQVLEVEEGQHLAYTVLGGIPVRNYRADVTQTPARDGTHIRWSAAWDATLAGRIVQRSLREAFPQIVAGLVAAAERHAGSGSSGSD